MQTQGRATLPSRPHLLCVGGEDHHLRIPFLVALRDRGFRISVASNGEPVPFMQAGFEHRAIRLGRFLDPLADWTTLRSFSRLIADLQPSLVQCFDTKPDLLMPLAARAAGSAPIISTINGLGWLYSSRSPVALALRPLFCALQRAASRSTAVTIFQNYEDHRFFTRQRMVGRSGDLVIPGSGIDVEKLDRASTTAATPEDLRRELGLGEGQVVLTVSRITRQKGIATLLDAARLVHERRPNVRFILVGRADTEGRLAVSKADIERHAPYVLAVGWRSDVPALLRLADVFAYPTELREGVPRALLEAAAVACPIVTTSMPGCSDVVRDGWSGFIVPPRAPRWLAERILDLLADRQTAETVAGRAASWVRQEFNLSITVSRYAEVYERLLAEAPAFAGGT